MSWYRVENSRSSTRDHDHKMEQCGYWVNIEGSEKPEATTEIDGRKNASTMDNLIGS